MTQRAELLGGASIPPFSSTDDLDAGTPQVGCITPPPSESPHTLRRNGSDFDVSRTPLSNRHQAGEVWSPSNRNTAGLLTFDTPHGVAGTRGPPSGESPRPRMSNSMSINEPSPHQSLRHRTPSPQAGAFGGSPGQGGITPPLRESPGGGLMGQYGFGGSLNVGQETVHLGAPATSHGVASNTASHLLPTNATLANAAVRRGRAGSSLRRPPGGLGAQRAFTAVDAQTPPTQKARYGDAAERHAGYDDDDMDFTSPSKTRGRPLMTRKDTNRRRLLGRITIVGLGLMMAAVIAHEAWVAAFEGSGTREDSRRGAASSGRAPVPANQQLHAPKAEAPAVDPALVGASFRDFAEASRASTLIKSAGPFLPEACRGSVDGDRTSARTWVNCAVGASLAHWRQRHSDSDAGARKSGAGPAVAMASDVMLATGRDAGEHAAVDPAIRSLVEERLGGHMVTRGTAGVNDPPFDAVLATDQTLRRAAGESCFTAKSVLRSMLPSFVAPGGVLVTELAVVATATSNNKDAVADGRCLLSVASVEAAVKEWRGQGPFSVEVYVPEQARVAAVGITVTATDGTLHTVVPVVLSFFKASQHQHGSFVNSQHPATQRQQQQQQQQYAANSQVHSHGQAVCGLLAPFQFPSDEKAKAAIALAEANRFSVPADAAMPTTTTKPTHDTFEGSCVDLLRSLLAVSDVATHSLRSEVHRNQFEQLRNRRRQWELCRVAHVIDATIAKTHGKARMTVAGNHRVAVLDAGRDLVASYAATRGFSVVLVEPGAVTEVRDADILAEAVDDNLNQAAAHQRTPPLSRSRPAYSVEEALYLRRVTAVELNNRVTFASPAADVIAAFDSTSFSEVSGPVAVDAHAAGTRRARPLTGAFDVVASTRMAARLGPDCVTALASALAAAGKLLKPGGVCVHVLEVIVRDGAGSAQRPVGAACRYTLAEVEHALAVATKSAGLEFEPLETAHLGRCSTDREGGASTFGAPEKHHTPASFEFFDPRNAAAIFTRQGFVDPAAGPRLLNLATKRHDASQKRRADAGVRSRGYYPENMLHVAELDDVTSQVVTSLVVVGRKPASDAADSNHHHDKNNNDETSGAAKGTTYDVSRLLRVMRPASISDAPKSHTPSLSDSKRPFCNDVVQSAMQKPPEERRRRWELCAVAHELRSLAEAPAGEVAAEIGVGGSSNAKNHHRRRWGLAMLRSDAAGSDARVETVSSDGSDVDGAAATKSDAAADRVAVAGQDALLHWMATTQPLGFHLVTPSVAAAVARQEAAHEHDWLQTHALVDPAAKAFTVPDSLSRLPEHEKPDFGFTLGAPLSRLPGGCDDTVAAVATFAAALKPGALMVHTLEVILSSRLQEPMFIGGVCYLSELELRRLSARLQLAGKHRVAPFDLAVGISAEVLAQLQRSPSEDPLVRHHHEGNFFYTTFVLVVETAGASATSRRL